MVLICICLMTFSVFSCAYYPFVRHLTNVCECLFVRCLIWNVCSESLFFKLSSLSLLLSYECSLFMLDKVPCQIWFVYISLVLWVLFTFLMVSFEVQMLFLMKYSFYVAVFFVCFLVLQWSFERQKYGETHWILSVLKVF